MLETHHLRRMLTSGGLPEGARLEFRAILDFLEVKARNTVTQFLKKIIIDLPDRDLEKFFVTSKNICVDDRNFQAVLKEVFAARTVIKKEQVKRYIHETFQEAHDDTIVSSVGDRVLETSTDEALHEVLIRLNIMATVIEELDAGNLYGFAGNGSANIMFQVRLSNGDVVVVNFRWNPLMQRWDCEGRDPGKWGIGRSRLSTKH